MKRKLFHGWNPDLPDHRDFIYAAPPIEKIPSAVDLRAKCPPVYNQGHLGSCTGNAIAGAFHFEEIRQKKKNLFMPSRLFIYYNERVIEHSIKSDSGGQIRDGIKTVVKQGVCEEKIWKYSINKFAAKPPAQCYKQALQNQVDSYQRINQTLTQLKGCLAEGFPFVFGFTVYEKFESPEVAKSGTLNMPTKNEKCLGGHAVMAVGYEDAKQIFIVRNSWGEEWGMKGYFTMPYNYISNTNLADDFWTIRMVE